MRKLSIVAALALSVAVFPSTALADPPLPEGCEKVRGTIVCEEEETVGNAPEHSKAQRTKTTTTKKGSFQSSHEEEQTCEGPPGQCK